MMTSTLTPPEIDQARPRVPDPARPAAPAKILFLSFDIRSRFGGIQRFDQRVTRVLGDMQQRGEADVRVLSLRDADHVPADATVPFDIKGAAGSKPRCAWRFVKAVLSHKPDIILFGHVLLTPLAAISRRLAPAAKNVMFAHGVEVWDDPAFARVSKTSRWAVGKYIDRILVVSRFTGERIKRVFGLPEERLSIFPNAVDVSGLTEQGGPDRPQADNPATNEPKRLLTVARLDEWGKGVGAMIEALPKVISRIGAVEYTIVGDGKLRGEMEQLAHGGGAADNIRFAGRVSDEELESLYRSADAFVMPSQKEGFGIVYLEAWKYGLPVLAGDRDAGAEVVEHGADGVVVDPTSADAIADGAARLLADRAEAARMGEAGRRKLVREYSHERFAERFERAMRSLTAAGAVGAAGDGK